MRSRLLSLLNWSFDYSLLKFGWLFLLFVHLPFGYLNRKLAFIRNWVHLQLRMGLKRHPRKVANIQRQIQKWHQFGGGKQMCTAGERNCQMGSRRPKYKGNCFQIRMDELKDIIEISSSDSFVRAEPGVTISQLLDALLPLGLTLPVVPELGQFTIGSLILCGGVGSGSGRHGLFQHNCLAFEIVTSFGEVIVAERGGEHQSLFFGIPWSMGSLGLLVSATLQTIPCPPFVKLIYQPVLSPKELCGRLQEESHPRAGNDFVEAIQFDRNNSVIISAKFADRMPKNDRGSLNRIALWHKPFFYRTVRRVIDKGVGKTEYIPSAEFYQRHWRSLFWELDRILPFCWAFPFRFVVGWLFPPQLPLFSSRRAQRLFGRQHILQNTLIPIRSVPELIKLVDEQFRVYPLWLCPAALPAQPGLLRNRQGLKTLYANVGIYGRCQNGQVGEEEDGRRQMAEKLRSVEKMAREVHGFQMLCADSHQTAAEFWDMFDASLYDWLRAKYDCKGQMPNVYDKVCMENWED